MTTEINCPDTIGKDNDIELENARFMEFNLLRESR
jgi:hypothetical protein